MSIHRKLKTKMKREEIERNAKLIAEAYALSFEVGQHNIGYIEFSKAEKLAQILGLKDERDKIEEIEDINGKIMEVEEEEYQDLFTYASNINEIHKYIQNAKKRKTKIEENKKEFEKIMETIKAKI